MTSPVDSKPRNKQAIRAMRFKLNNQTVFAATGGKELNPELPCVVFLHGSGLDHRSWALQTRWFAFHGFSVFAPDFPAHSLSAGEPLTSIEEMAAWLISALQVAGIKKAHLVGHSQGFLVALEAAKQAPKKVLTITAVASAARIAVNPALIETAQKSAEQAADLMLQWGFGHKAQYGISAIPGMQPIAIGRCIMAKNPLAADLIACSNYQGGDEIAQTLKLPANVILGSEDRMTPLKNGQILAKKMQAQTSVIQGYGHMLPIEAPKHTLNAIKKLIALNSNEI